MVCFALVVFDVWLVGLKKSRKINIKADVRVYLLIKIVTVELLGLV